MITQDQITAALRKLGATRPGELADHMQVEHTALKYHLKKMLDAGTIKAAGSTASRRVMLPDQKFEDTGAPPQHQKRTKRKKAKRTKHRKAAAPRTARATERFIPAVDADSRLVLINGSEPQIFTEDQTEAIATLLFQHYKD